MNEESYTKSFHSLVHLQRRSNNAQTSTVNGSHYEPSDDTGICEGWQTHFNDLATPANNVLFDKEYMTKINDNLIHIEQACRHSC